VNVIKQLAVLDKAVALERVGGDMELLQEMAQLYLEEYPSQMQALRAAVQTRDAKGVERAAHSLKGSVGNFGAAAAQSAALTVEMMGRHDDLAQLDSAFRLLEEALTDLHPEMEGLLAGV
jgi:two-component system, sensor histidine kinase and response regulator